MTKKRTLRAISLLMLLIAVVFVFCALSNPTLGRVIYIGTLKFGVEQWRICYAAYVIVMVGLFVVSFFIKDRKQ